MLTEKDVEQVETLYSEALNDVTEIEYQGMSVIYPKSVSKLMMRFQERPWMNYEYQPELLETYLQRSDTLNLVELKSALTGISRAERFSDGSWLKVLQERRLDKLIVRARVLTESPISQEESSKGGANERF